MNIAKRILVKNQMSRTIRNLERGGWNGLDDIGMIRDPPKIRIGKVR